MKQETFFRGSIGAAFVAFIFCLGAPAAFAQQSTAFTYQGRFTDTSVQQPTNRTYAMTFRLYDAETGGNQIPNTADFNSMVSVVNGIFTVKLDFGAAAFATAGARYLEMQVDNQILTPRQEITSTPFSQRALNAANADSLGGTAASQYLTTNNANTSFIRNTTQQQSGSFNVSGSGSVGGTLAANQVAVGGGVLARGGAPGANGATNNGYAFNGIGDNDSGLFSNGNGQVSLYADNTERASVSSSGLSVTGNLTISGTLTVGSVASSGGTTPLCVNGSNLVAGCNNSRYAETFTISNSTQGTFTHGLNTFDVMVTLYKSNGDGTWSIVPIDNSEVSFRLLNANSLRLTVIPSGTFRLLVWR